jgi:hypothetical protein
MVLDLSIICNYSEWRCSLFSIVLCTINNATVVFFLGRTNETNTLNSFVVEYSTIININSKFPSTYYYNNTVFANDMSLKKLFVYTLRLDFLALESDGCWMNYHMYVVYFGFSYLRFFICETKYRS